MRKAVLFVATGAGSGYAPIAPGTAGAGVGLLIYGVLVLGLGLSNGVLLALTAALTALGIWAAGRAEQLFGKHDDGRITVDEVVGMWVSLLWLPASLEVALVAFFLFRLFDITKPPPCRAAERAGGGLGVMLDDLIAGAYANLVGQVLWRIAFPEGWL